MNAMVQFRLWVKESPATERKLAASAILLAIALLSWLLVPARTNVTPEFSAGTVSQSESLGAEDSLAPEAQAGTGDQPVAVAPSASNTSGSSFHDVAGGGTSQPNSGQSRRLTATDRGVTAESIKVGFTILNLGGTEALGYASGTRTDTRQVIDALVNHANKQGGVLGRKIVAVKVSPNLIDPADQREKCLELTETNKVFAVIDSLAFLYETATACVTAEHRTLLINGNPGSSQNVQRGFPYLVSVQKDDNRKMKDIVSAAKGTGFFDARNGFRKLGLFEDACSPTVFDAPKNGLKAYLRAAGVTTWSEFRSECDVASQQRSGSQAVLQFRQDGVTNVIIASQSAAMKSYLNAAKAANYFPKYFTGDYVNLASGQVAKGFEPQGFNGAIGVTQLHAGEGAVGKPLPPPVKACSKIFTDYGLPPVQHDGPDDLGRHIEALQLCENFRLFLQVARTVGPNLTRSNWVAKLSSVGDFRPAWSDLARFTPAGKMTGGDTTKLIKWHGDCTCWKEISRFGPAAG